MTEILAYYHGGMPGLIAGHFITPPSERLTTPTEEVTNPERIYVTTDFSLARSYAAQWNRHGGGTVYRVEPTALAPDPDSADDFNHEAQRARILEVSETYVTMSFLEISKIQGPGKRWSTHEDHVYDSKGWLLPSPQMLQAGITAADCRKLGMRWAPLEVLEMLTTKLRRFPTSQEFRLFLSGLDKTLAQHRPTKEQITSTSPEELQRLMEA